MDKRKDAGTKRYAKRIKDLGRLPKGKVTVDDVIAVNDINDLLAEVQSKRGQMDGLLVAWENSDGRISYRYVKVNALSVVSICEIIKQHIIQENWLSED